MDIRNFSPRDKYTTIFGVTDPDILNAKGSGPVTSDGNRWENARTGKGEESAISNTSDRKKAPKRTVMVGESQQEHRRYKTTAGAK